MTKLALGVYEQRPELVADANAGGAWAVLLFFRALALASSVRGGATVFGRWFWSGADQDAMLQGASLDQLRQLGRSHAAWLAGQYPGVRVWQALNEVMRSPHLEIADPQERARAMATATDWLQRQMAYELGFLEGLPDGCLGCMVNAPPGVEPTDDPGDPQAPWFGTFAELVAPVLGHPKCGYFGGHAYTKSQTARLQDDPAWYALRPQRVSAALRRVGVRPPPRAITELGWADGWRNTGMADYQCGQDVCWYGDQIAADPDVAVSFVYCHGDPGGWQSHDTYGTGIPGYMRDWNLAHAGAPVPPGPPAPPAPPVPPAPEPPTGGGTVPITEEMKAYLSWAVARANNGQDWRPVDAFQAHLKALGCDATDPYRYGYPCSPKA